MCTFYCEAKNKQRFLSDKQTHLCKKEFYYFHYNKYTAYEMTFLNVFLINNVYVHADKHSNIKKDMGGSTLKYHILSSYTCNSRLILIRGENKTRTLINENIYLVIF